jgi:alkylation response protein AidB-like acyl-CoA dehydrogenase
MATALSAEQTDLRDTVAALVSKRGQDTDLWAELAAMGLVGLIVTEEYGGSGAGATELAVVAEQFGAGLLGAPFLSAAVLTPYLLLALGDTRECAEALPRISAGQLTATVAFAETGSARPPAHPDTRAERDGDGWRITGEKTYVLDAPGAQRFYVLAETGSETGIFAVDRDAAGLDLTELGTVDQTRGLGALSMVGTSARRVGGDGAAALQTALDQAAVALIAEQAGGAMHAMTMACDYARTRYQFGRAIGSFQAIKHMCVDMLLEAQSAVSAARHVAAAFDAGEPDRLTDLALAQAYCSEAFVSVAADTIQVHGGIGFTWEHPAHRYLRRARTDAQIFGDPAWHRERYVRLREENS